MKEDITLKKRCLKLFAFAVLTLILMVIIKYVFFQNIPDKDNKKEIWAFCLFILIEILIWLSSGIAASAFTLFISKKTDYEQKKRIAITDYFNDAQTLYLEILKLMPLVNNNWTNAAKSFLDFRPFYMLWKKMIHNYQSMTFIEKDEKIQTTIESIDREFKAILAPIMVANMSLSVNATNPAPQCNNKGIFKIEESITDVTYTPLAQETILPLLQELETITRGTEILKENIFISYSYKKNKNNPKQQTISGYSKKLQLCHKNSYLKKLIDTFFVKHKRRG